MGNLSALVELLRNSFIIFIVGLVILIEWSIALFIHLNFELFRLIYDFLLRVAILLKHLMILEVEVVEVLLSILTT